MTVEAPRSRNPWLKVRSVAAPNSPSDESVVADNEERIKRLTRISRDCAAGRNAEVFVQHRLQLGQSSGQLLPLTHQLGMRRCVKQLRQGRLTALRERPFPQAAVRSARKRIEARRPPLHFVDLLQ